jgi:hypothetical protein
MRQRGGFFVKIGEQRVALLAVGREAKHPACDAGDVVGHRRLRLLRAPAALHPCQHPGGVGQRALARGRQGEVLARASALHRQGIGQRVADESLLLQPGQRGVDRANRDVAARRAGRVRAREAGDTGTLGRGVLVAGLAGEVSMAVGFQRNMGLLVLAIWLILYGLSGMVALGLPAPLMGILALIAGVLILAGR